MRQLCQFAICRSRCTRVPRILIVLLIFGAVLYLFNALPLIIVRRVTDNSTLESSNKELTVTPIDYASSSHAPDKQTCVFPKLELNDTEIMKFFIKYPRLECSVDPDWLIIDNEQFIITESAQRTHPDVRCEAYPIVKVTDFKTKELAPLKDIKNGTVIDNDFYRVNCSSSDGKAYMNYLAGIRHDPQIHKRPIKSNPDGLDLDVIIIGLDSMSRLAYHRHLPKSTDYFVNILGGIQMEGYNILGDGTPSALMPILLGKREEELHEARRGYEGARPVDDFPWIWNDFRDAGYVTNYAEDDAYLGTFQYRLLGFRNQPTDHYFRYFCVAAEPNYNKFLRHCQGSKPRHLVVLDYMKQMFLMYPDRRKWMFSFQSQLSHQDNNQASMMDDDLVDHLQFLHVNKYLDKAVLIMMADHGCRFTKVRATAQGKLEERLPFFGIRLPDWFKQKYPQILRNLQTNSQRLSTPFDVHETLLEILHFTGSGKADISKRGVSMFKEVPLDRSCEMAQIDPHWCSCLDWEPENVTSTVISHVVKKIIDTFNNYTSIYRNLCDVLELDQVISARSLKVKDAVLRFKDTNDGGRGRFGIMNDVTRHSKILYQVTLTTRPGGGLFEVTVTHDLQKSLFHLDAKDISRINKYGTSPWCVENLNSFLRPYCYCSKQLPDKTHSKISGQQENQKDSSLQSKL